MRSIDVPEQLRRKAATLVARRAQANATAAIAPFTEWMTRATPPEMLISIVMPTRNRAPVLGRAVDSVLAQKHGRWELLVADDASVDDTAALVRRVDDVRVKLLTGSRVGCAGARNRALQAAQGELICYLDDDNEMAPLWLTSLSWAASSFPERSTFYGARIVDGGEIVLGMRPSRLPQFHFVPYRRGLLKIANFIDIGVFAHRGSLQLRFNETLSQAADWDFILKATAWDSPLPLPIVASYYSTSREDRLSTDPRLRHEADRVRLDRRAKEKPTTWRE